MINKIYDILGSIFLIFAAPFLIVGLVIIFVSKCILRSTYLDYDEAYDRMSKEFSIIITILKQRIKKRVKEEKSKNLIYN